jgi:hypothetical protein
MPSPNRLRTWATIAFAAFATFALAQEQPKVTMTLPATKTSNVAAEIKKQTGIQIVCNPTVANIPILVSVTDAPLDELLARIAQVTGGELIKQGEGFILTKSDKLRTEEANRENGWIIAAFERGKKATLGDMGAADRWDQRTLDDMVAKAQAQRAQMEQRVSNVRRQQGAQITMFDSSMANMTPATGAARRALQMLPASVLASIKPGERAVYSTAANRMQRRMPINVTPIASDFVYNHNLLAKAAPQLRPIEGVNIVGGLTAGEPITNVVETHLILSRGYRSTAVQVEIKFVDRNGLYVGQGSTSVTPQYAPMQPATSEEGKVIELSDLSRQMAVIMAQELAAPTSDRNVYRVTSVGGGGGAYMTIDGGDGSLPKQFSEELLNVFVNPDRFDPTSLYVSECYIQAAKAEGKDLVAAFPDTIIKEMARVLVKGNVTHKGVLAGSPAFGLSVDSGTDWMVVTPTWANAARETRFDRDEAAKLFRAVNGRGFATLEELADYSFSVTLGLPDRPLDTVYLSLINKDVGDQLTEYTSMNLDLLQLYGSVPESTKKQGGEKIQLQYRTLSAQAKRLADHAYYSRASGFTMPPFAGNEKVSAVFMTMETTPTGKPMPPSNSILMEPTEALPNGIPGEALVNIDRTLQDGVFASTKGIRGGQMLTAEELGMRQGMLEANFSGGSAPAQFDTFRPAQILGVHVTFDLGDFGRPSAYFKDAWFVSGSRQVSYNQLPEGFRAKVELTKQNMLRPPTEIPATSGGVRIRGGGGG